MNIIHVNYKHTQIGVLKKQYKLCEWLSSWIYIVDIIMII